MVEAVYMYIYCLENSIDRGARQATVHGTAVSHTTEDTHTHTPQTQKVINMEWTGDDLMNFASFVGS